MACFHSGDLSPSELRKTIAGFSWPAPPLLMAFSPAEAVLDRFDPELLDRMGPTDQGRVFGPSGELRWRDLYGTFRVVYLGEGPGPQGLEDFSGELAGVSPVTRTLFLWGERTDTENEWLEQQVPHRFRYPIEGTEYSRGRAALEVEDWVDAAGLPQFSRYRDLVEVKGGI